LFLVLFPFSDENEWTSKIQDFGHVLFYFLLTFFSLTFLKNKTNSISIRKRYFFTFIGINGIGLFGEILQIPGPRDASFEDLVRDLSGVSGGLLWHALTDSDVKIFKNLKPLFRKRLQYLVVFLMSLYLIPLFLTGFIEYNRKKVFPSICTFEHWWEIHDIEMTYAALQIVTVPEPWHNNTSKRTSLITFNNAEYPGISMFPLYPTWGGYSTFSFLIYSECQDTVALELRIHDNKHDEKYSDRFNTNISVIPGQNSYNIPLNQIIHGPKYRLLDINNISEIILFAESYQKPFTLFIDEFSLK
jgi:hypothetical protein